jgi:hypothetical protein
VKRCDGRLYRPIDVLTTLGPPPQRAKFDEALQSYIHAIEALDAAIKWEKDANRKKSYDVKKREYLKRAEAIKKIISEPVGTSLSPHLFPPLHRPDPSSWNCYHLSNLSISHETLAAASSQAKGCSGGWK